jgi:hypothetical protein
MASVKAGETPSETHINGYNTARATLLDLGVVVPSVAELIAPPVAPEAPVVDLDAPMPEDIPNSSGAMEEDH